jgi:hypothetical protein
MRMLALATLHREGLIAMTGRLVSLARPDPSFGLRVRDRRIGMGWPIVEAAQRAGISPHSWWLVERGAVEPMSLQGFRIAAVLNTSVVLLMATSG